MKDIIYKKQMVSVKELIMKPKSELVQLFYQNPVHYSKEAEKFAHYEIPVMTTDFTVLSHYEDIIAAHTNQCEQMEVIVAEGLSEGDVIRFIFKSIYFKRYTADVKIKLIKLLSDYLNNEKEGKKWAAELHKRNFLDINEKIGEIMTCSKETVKYNKRIKTGSDSLIIDVDQFNIEIDNDKIGVRYRDDRWSLDRSKCKIKQVGLFIIIKVPINSISK